MPSEIDDIFASKGKVPALSTKASSSSILDNNKKKKKDKSAKRKREETDSKDLVPTKPPKQRVPETVFDPSAVLPSITKSKDSKAEQITAKPAKNTRLKKDREEEQRFKDSRGSGPRRKTDEGFLIYKEDELGIKDEGGDTPLCPFDCQCCF